MSITVIKPGLLSTVQDSGRIGYGKFGVSVSGAMDHISHRTANWLVGNHEDEATLELTWSGFTAEFGQDQWVAITGADFSPAIEGVSVPMWRPVFVRKGSRLTFHKPVSGCRAYLAVAGGMDVPEVMGSRSTYLRAGIGGFHGRALQPGDVLDVRAGGFSAPATRLNKGDFFYSVKWSIPAAVFLKDDHQPIIRVIRGNQFDDFDAESRRSLFDQTFQVTSQSDRMGYRLSGSPLRLSTPKEYISEAVTPGTVQVPADGQPIILMADCQTHGGYPKIAQVASVDIPLVAQVPPGGCIRFNEITLQEAEALLIDRSRKLRLLSRMIDIKLKEEYDAAGGSKC
ncbi:biotin-dependent carboxyltransferase family protein [Paenibacillus faecalis]|uniref:5-oxoprolinase subunit C family protein n=1 Tax=Paenibacillus faecalis TaxID=2079532 RepID=UPI000D0F2460|nr:biotin-dependent carboxyltransferase family protein [Paenibacillus faecalis]